MSWSFSSLVIFTKLIPPSSGTVTSEVLTAISLQPSQPLSIIAAMTA